ncbi:MAG: hypothetical protein JWP76_3569 [Dactylosporangium sp.]|nr:hypothetical protein [Dactylosporangium sp.]
MQPRIRWTALAGIAAGALTLSMISSPVMAAPPGSPPPSPAKTANPTDPTKNATPSTPTKKAKPAGTQGARVPGDVSAAVGRGPTDVLVTFDSGPGLTKLLSATRQRADKSSRQAGADAAASTFATTKRDALARAGRGLRVERDYDRLPIQMVKVDSQRALAALAAAPGVTGVALPKRMMKTATPPDLTLIHQPQAVQAGYTGAGVSVAVVDTGTDYTLPGVGGEFGDCSGGPGTGTCRIDKIVDATNTGLRDSDTDGHHGTNVSGIIAETAPGAHLAVYGVFGNNPVTGTYEAADGDILAALNAITRDGPAANIRAVNLSLGVGGTYHTSECTDSIYSTAFLNLRALGIVPVVSAGNSAEDANVFNSGVAEPACASGAVRVGAVYHSNSGDHSWRSGCTDTNPTVDHIACFSQTGPLLSLLAPGVDITAAGISESGTSQAAPHAAGAVADLVSASPHATAQQVVRALVTTGTPITDSRDNTRVNRLDIAAAAQAVQAPGAEVADPACTSQNLPANDDGSTGAVSLPFPASFFGTTYSSLFVNNNGNVTFDGPQATYTPFTIGASTPPMIAPFFADVDTQGAGSALVTYGTTVFGNRPAFCVDWDNVGYYSSHDNKLNSVQLLLVDRGDVGAGDFDMVMNYGALTWETGDASGGSNGLGGTPAGAGFSAGDGNPDHFFQFPGSLTHLGLLDSNTSTGLVNNSRGSLQLGRYIFPVRNGAPPGAGTITGVVRDSSGTPQGSSPVQACPQTGSCVVGVTGPDGRYTIVGVPAGSWNLTALPPQGSSLLPGRAGPLTVAVGSTVNQDLVLEGPHAIPPGTTITDHGTTVGGVPVIFWTDPLSLDTTGCAGGTASYTMSLGSRTLRSGQLTETPPGSGHYHASIDPLYPEHGDAAVSITVNCPDATTTHVDFTVYIDPSGTVVDTTGAAVPGATVTLLRSDTAAGPFTAVPDGSPIMSPSARSNPETTGADGAFHWDVLAGFYQVQATKAGCHAVGSADPAATSAVYEVPPPRLGIILTLDCAPPVTPSTTALTANPSPASVGQQVVLTATVAGDGAVPTGTVAFTSSDNSITTCATQPLTGGQATCVVTFAHATTAPVTLTAAYTGDATHSPSSNTTALTVGRATPAVTWTPPPAVTYPTPLGSSQLNATVNVAGTFTYTLHAGGAPATGAVLHAGPGQLIDVAFTPDNTADYTSATAQVSVTVLPGSQTITFAAISPEMAAQPSFSVGPLASASSGLPVAFTASGPCTVTPTGDVTVTGNGNCTLTANQPGNADYQAATPVMQTVAVGTAPASPITLTASATTINGYQPVQLTATAAQDVSSTREMIQIVDQSAGNRVIAHCHAGTTCTATVTFAPSQHTYVARIAARAVRVSSAPVTVTWTAPTVSLTASTTTPAVAAPVTLTAVASEDMGPTPWAIWIVDPTTHRVLTKCGVGSTCTATVAAPGPVTYQAIIATPQGRQVQAGQPATVTVDWPPLTLSLSASDAHPMADRAVTLTATGNGDVGPTDYAIVIVDVTTPGREVALISCGTGNSCTANVSRHAGSRSYAAKVAQPNGSGAVFTSTSTTVTWGAAGSGIRSRTGIAFS